MKAGNGAGFAPGSTRAMKREDERGRAHYTGHADTISQDTLSKIIIIATHTFERPSPLTAASALTNLRCAQIIRSSGALRTHNENRTEVLCPRVTQAAMIAAA